MHLNELKVIMFKTNDSFISSYWLYLEISDKFLLSKLLITKFKINCIIDGRLKYYHDKIKDKLYSAISRTTASYAFIEIILEYDMRNNFLHTIKLFTYQIKL